MKYYLKEPIAALRKVPVFMVALAPASDGSGVGGLAGSLTVKVSKDGGAFAAMAGTIAEVTGGIAGSYVISFAVGDFDTAGVLAYQVTDGTSVARMFTDAIVIEPNASDELWYGGAASATGSTVTLDATAVATDHYYAGDGHGCEVLVVDGVGKGQVRWATEYHASRAMDIVPNWVTNPDSTSKIRLLPGSGRLAVDERTATTAAVQASLTTALADLDRVLALQHRHTMLDNFVYGANNVVTSVRKRIFADAAALAAATPGAGNGADGEVKRYTCTAVDAGSGQISSFKQTENL